jgi:hypothetical protein
MADTSTTTKSNGFGVLDLLGIATGGLGGFLASRAQRKQREADEKLSRENTGANIASEESMANPYRHQLEQAGALGRLDAMGHASYAPVTVAPPARYTASAPTITGGYSWQPSAQMQGDARALQTSVRAGRTAPTMANPANYGRTGALDLLSVAAGRADPSMPVAPALPGPGAFGNTMSQRVAITQFERDHPGWTLDPTTGQPVRHV